MTPNFTRGNKQLIITPGRFIRIYHTPESKINEAMEVVQSALDRKLPFAYKTVKPMYYLEYVGRHQDLTVERRYDDDPELIDWVYEYRRCTSFDTTTRNNMMNNYYKLKRALRLLHDEGYVKTYWVRNDRRRFRCIWYVDKPNEPLNVTAVDYGQFPPDYKQDLHVPRYKYRKKYQRREQYADNMLLAMRKAFPVGDIKQGKVQPYVEVNENANGGEWDAYTLIQREQDNLIQRANNYNTKQRARELREWFIAVIARYMPANKLGKVVDAYA